MRKRQEDFNDVDEVDESEIDIEAEDKAHVKVNQIPHSQFNRINQNNDNKSEMSMVIQGNNSLNFADAQQYTIQSLTMNNNNILGGYSSSEVQTPGLDQYKNQS